MYRQLFLQHSGVLRTSVLIEHGLSQTKIAKAVAAGGLVRIRRGWIADPAADPQLVFAAQYSLTLTCVTQAKRLGLWVRDSTLPHFSARHHSVPPLPFNARVHYAAPPVPRPPHLLADPIENALVVLAQCCSFEDAVATWDSALNKKLVSRETLARLPLTRRIQDVLDATSEYSDSGLESIFRTRLKWLKIPLRQQVRILGHRIDLLIGERLIVQIDGGHHVGAQRTSDISHDAVLRLHGYTVFRFGYDQVIHGWPGVQDTIMQALAQGLHVASQ